MALRNTGCPAVRARGIRTVYVTMIARVAHIAAVVACFVCAIRIDMVGIVVRIAWTARKSISIECAITWIRFDLIRFKPLIPIKNWDATIYVVIYMFPLPVLINMPPAFRMAIYIATTKIAWPSSASVAAVRTYHRTRLIVFCSWIRRICMLMDSLELCQNVTYIGLIQLIPEGEPTPGICKISVFAGFHKFRNIRFSNRIRCRP